MPLKKLSSKSSWLCSARFVSVPPLVEAGSGPSFECLLGVAIAVPLQLKSARLVDASWIITATLGSANRSRASAPFGDVATPYSPFARGSCLPHTSPLTKGGLGGGLLPAPIDDPVLSVEKIGR